MAKKKKINYLSNKELLLAINECKKTYCYFIDEQYANFDYIIHNKDDILKNDVILEAKKARAKRLEELENRRLIMEGEDPKEHDTKIDPHSIENNEIVFRLMTYDHVPRDPERKKNPKTIADHCVKVPFPPFQHWIIDEGNELKMVGKSHWSDGLENGQFDLTQGRITDKLAKMFFMLVTRYSTKPNFAGYSYIDDIRSNALVHLSSVGLKFDESKSDNPFAYYTQIIKASFIATLNEEKKIQKTRDEILMHKGSDPSSTAIIDHEFREYEEANREDDK